MEIFLYTLGIYLTCGASVFIVSFIMGYLCIGYEEESFMEIIGTFAFLCLYWPCTIYAVISRKSNKPPVIS